MSEIYIPLVIGGQTHFVFIRFQIEEGLVVFGGQIMRPKAGSHLCDHIAEAPEWLIAMIEQDFNDGGPIFEQCHAAHAKQIAVTNRVREQT